MEPKSLNVLGEGPRSHAGFGLFQGIFSDIFNFRESLQIPTDEPLNEETSRRYFRDTLQGLEYRKSKLTI